MLTDLTIAIDSPLTIHHYPIKMEENFSPQQSLALIQNMIAKTKNNLAENRLYFLFWGWITFIAILSQFALIVWLQYERHYLVWLITIPASIFTVIYSVRYERKTGVRSFVGDSMSALWVGIGISFGILSFIISKSPGGWNYCWPFFILFYGLGTFVSGMLIQFRPLIVGGIINWVLAIVCVFLPMEYQLLMGALAILTSYIIPGHLLPSKN